MAHQHHGPHAMEPPAAPARRNGRLHGGGALPVRSAVALAGGAALFLFGAAALRRAFRIGPIGVRIAGALLALPTILLGTRFAATAELLALVVLFAAVLIVERLRAGDSTSPA
jgi:uncharacterized paraquat-inducible protein A